MVILSNSAPWQEDGRNLLSMFSHPIFLLSPLWQILRWQIRIYSPLQGCGNANSEHQIYYSFRFKWDCCFQSSDFVCVVISLNELETEIFSAIFLSKAFPTLFRMTISLCYVHASHLAAPRPRTRTGPPCVSSRRRRWWWRARWRCAPAQGLVFASIRINKRMFRTNLDNNFLLKVDPWENLLLDWMPFLMYFFLATKWDIILTKGDRSFFETGIRET